MATKVASDSSNQSIRSRQITRTALTGIVAKAAMFLPTLLIAWVAVPKLGAERYGVLMTVLSLLGFLNVADLGVGASLITSLSRESATGNFNRVRQIQANGFAITAGMSIFILVLALCLSSFEVGTHIFKSSTETIQIEGTAAIIVFICLFSVTLPLNLVSKIQLGLQDGHIANCWQALASIINFGCGVAAASFIATVPSIICGMMVGTVICGFINLYFYYRGKPDYCPRIKDVSLPVIKIILNDSVFYLVLQMVFMFSYAVDTLLVARFFGAEQASVYSLCDRVFSIVAVAVSIVTGPLWVAYGDALSRGEFRWAILTLKSSTLRIFIAALFISLVILVGLSPLMNLLSRGHLNPPWTLAFVMTFWRVIEAIGGAISVFMYASKENQVALICGVVTAVVSICMKVLFLPFSTFLAIPIISAISYIIFCLIPSVIWIVRKNQVVN